MVPLLLDTQSQCIPYYQKAAGMHILSVLGALFSALVFVAPSPLNPTLARSQLPRSEPPTPLPSIAPRKLVVSSSPTHALTVTTYASLLPLSVASSALGNFYTALFSSASGPWSNLPALPSFTAAYGNVFMDFRASEPYLVPWSFVAEFAERMMHATQRGFTGQFCGEYRHLATGAVIEVGLRVVLVAAAA